MRAVGRDAAFKDVLVAAARKPRFRMSSDHIAPHLNGRGYKLKTITDRSSIMVAASASEWISWDRARPARTDFRLTLLAGETPAVPRDQAPLAPSGRAATPWPPRRGAE